MGSYSIKNLEQLSGIKAHTIRIWEQRYSFIKPKRTDTNIRVYDEEDLKKVLNIVLLNKHGIKISKIATLSDREIQELVIQISNDDTSHSQQFQSLILSMIEYDEERFEKAINSCILKLGFEKAMVDVIYPFLQRVGLLWQTGGICTAQEHFITNLVRQKLIVAIDGQYNDNSKQRKKFMLFLPEGELHELSLLFASFLIKSRGFKVIYLGQSLPLQDVKQAERSHSPDYLVSIITSCPNEDQLQNYLSVLVEAVSIPIILSGHKIVSSNLSFPKNVEVLNDASEFIAFLEKLN